MWIYCAVGFAVVALFFVGLKIISVLIDRGIIRWTKSTSEDEDS